MFNLFKLFNRLFHRPRPAEVSEDVEYTENGTDNHETRNKAMLRIVGREQSGRGDSLVFLYPREERALLREVDRYQYSPTWGLSELQRWSSKSLPITLSLRKVVEALYPLALADNAINTEIADVLSALCALHNVYAKYPFDVAAQWHTEWESYWAESVRNILQTHNLLRLADAQHV